MRKWPEPALVERPTQTFPVPAAEQGSPDALPPAVGGRKVKRS